MILGRCGIKELGLHLNYLITQSKQIFGTFKESTAPMVGLGMHKLEYLNTGKITPEESFMNAYKEENYELEQIHPDNKRLQVIVYDKYEKANLHKVM